jgi:hypothetical protein
MSKQKSQCLRAFDAWTFAFAEISRACKNLPIFALGFLLTLGPEAHQIPNESASIGSFRLQSP